MIKQNLNFKKYLNIIQKITKKKGKILIICLNPQIKLFLKKIQLLNFFLIFEWTPGLLTNNKQIKPDLIIFFFKSILISKKIEIINEIYLNKIPLIIFSNNLKNNKHIMYKNINLNLVNIKYIYIFLILLSKYLNISKIYD